ncbi:hypothetical protein Hhel01_02553 [Haloferula helveola]
METPPSQELVPSAGTPPPAPERSGIHLEDNSWCMLTHLSALSGWVVPFGNFIGPLIVWILKKDTSPAVDAHGKEALNFQITGLIVTTVAAVITVVLTFVVIGIFLWPLLLLLPIVYNLIFPIIAAFQANEGKAYAYPMNWRIIQ